MSQLAGTRALITGASSGIVFAVARRLVLAGMDLHLVARDAAKLEVAREQLQAAAPAASVCVQAFDLDAPAAQVKLAFEGFDDKNIAVLVHSAGAFSAANIPDTLPPDFESLFRVNVSSALVLAQRFAVALEKNAGQIVLVNSSVAMHSAKAVPGAYASTKHAARALADSLRDAFNPKGVRLLSVYPGRTATPMQEAIFAAEGRSYPADQLLQSDDIAAMVVSALELPRTAEVTDISVRPLQKT